MATHANAEILYSFKVQARCSHGTGFGSGALQYAGPKVHAVAFVRERSGERQQQQRRVLLINKELETKRVTLEGLGPAATRTTGGSHERMTRKTHPHLLWIVLDAQN